jgi:predicted dehydrogenase
LGDIVSAVSTHPHKLWDKAPRWYWDKDTYAGTFHVLACHGVDQIRWLTGAEYTGVHAISTCMKHTDPPLTDHVQASFRLSNGACAVVTADWLTPLSSPSWGDTRFIIMGTEGSAHLKAYNGNHVLIVSNKKGTVEPALDVYKTPPFMENLIRAYEQGEETFISTADVFAVARTCIAAEESIEQGGAWVTIE